MPGFDGTGPRGMGPMTGGGRGFCSPWGFGRGYGFRRGYGFGGGMSYPMAGRWPGYGAPYGEVAYPGAMPYGSYAGPPMGVAPGVDPYAPQMTREQELDFLRNQAEAVKEQLDQLDARIKELEPEEK